MARWFVGDIQGCAAEFEDLLEKTGFEPGIDELWCLGDLIARGPDSPGVLRLWKSVGGRGVIGNHEVNTLRAYAAGSIPPSDSVKKIMTSPDADSLLDDLRRLPVLVFLESAGEGPDVWAVHAGIDPRWRDLHAVAARLNGAGSTDKLFADPELDFATRVRCCTPDGMRSRHAGPPEECEQPYRPWDDYYRGETLVVHGHWAARGHYRGRRTMGLDSGCVYGGHLTAWCQDDDRIVQVESRAR